MTKTPNEDWVSAHEGSIVVLDGATARTGTDALATSIEETAGQHLDCDLKHPGTPSAAAAMVRVRHDAVQYLVLGDVTVVIESADGDPTALIRRVRATEVADPTCTRWRRNKRSDDATVAYLRTDTRSR